MNFPSPISTVFYAIEHAIKSYRRFAQRNISQKIDGITLDQSLILMILEQDPSRNQRELGELLFKDLASVNRIIKLMIENTYLDKKLSSQDKRKVHLLVTEKGQSSLQEIKSIVQKNREIALEGISEQEVTQLIQTLKKISDNVNSSD